MKLADAADVYLELTERLQSDLALLAEAKDILRAHFAEHPEKKSYAGKVACKRSTPRRFDQGRAIELGYLDEAKIDACRVESSRIELIPLK